MGTTVSGNGCGGIISPRAGIRDAMSESRSTARVVSALSFFKELFSLLFLFCMYECIASLHVGMPVLCNACRGQKEVLDPLELELWMVVSCHVGAGNRTQVLCKSSYCP